jgi:hypothetical protein
MDPQEYLQRRRLDQKMAEEEQASLSGAYQERFDKPINVWAYNPYQGYGGGNTLGGGSDWSTSIPIIIVTIAAFILAGVAIYYGTKPSKEKDTSEYISPTPTYYPDETYTPMYKSGGDYDEYGMPLKRRRYGY